MDESSTIPRGALHRISTAQTRPRCRENKNRGNCNERHQRPTRREWSARRLLRIWWTRCFTRPPAMRTNRRRAKMHSGCSLILTRWRRLLRRPLRTLEGDYRLLEVWSLVRHDGALPHYPLALPLKVLGHDLRKQGVVKKRASFPLVRQQHCNTILYKPGLGGDSGLMMNDIPTTIGHV